MCIPKKSIFSFVWFMYCARNVPSEGKIVKQVTKTTKEDFSLIRNKIGNRVANLLKYLSY